MASVSCQLSVAAGQPTAWPRRTGTEASGAFSGHNNVIEAEAKPAPHEDRAPLLLSWDRAGQRCAYWRAIGPSLPSAARTLFPPHAASTVLRPVPPMASHPVHVHRGRWGVFRLLPRAGRHGWVTTGSVKNRTRRQAPRTGTGHEGRAAAGLPRRDRAGPHVWVRSRRDGANDGSGLRMPVPVASRSRHCYSAGDDPRALLLHAVMESSPGRGRTAASLCAGYTLNRNSRTSPSFTW